MRQLPHVCCAFAIQDAGFGGSAPRASSDLRRLMRRGAPFCFHPRPNFYPNVEIGFLMSRRGDIGVEFYLCRFGIGTSFALRPPAVWANAWVNWRSAHLDFLPAATCNTSDLGLLRLQRGNPGSLLAQVRQVKAMSRLGGTLLGYTQAARI